MASLRGSRTAARCDPARSSSRAARVIAVRPAPRLAEFEGRGIWYCASPLEAKLCDGEEVAIIGGGNSAGQATVFLSSHASRVHMLIRGEGLAASMSRYLINRIEATPSVALHPNTDVCGLCGNAAGRLASVS
jgi:thioredoxin reductase (NADPH)